MLTQSLSPEQRIMRARMGGLATAARHDMREHTKPARAASPAALTYFEHKVDPEGVLSPNERTRRATAAKRLHFAGLALKSSQARKARAG
jgi:hypothetical protein